MGIAINNVSKAFSSFPAVSNINLNIQSGEFLGLLGPSGSGKTTLLRLIAGLEKLDTGTILFNEKDYTNKNVKDRRVGFVFQHYALFKHMTVYDNIAFGLKVLPRKSRPSKEIINEKVFELLKLVQLEHLAARYPSQLSGGQRQRIALARALAVEPEVLLLDEPFGALDAKVRLEMRHWLREIHQKLNITTIFVTHDQEEALEMADTVVVMNQGKIEQIGSPDDVYQNPLNAFVYRFLGRVNEIKGSTLFENQLANTVGYIRPHDITLRRVQNGNSIPSEITHLHTFGSMIRIELRNWETKESFEAELTTEKCQKLGPLIKGDILYADFNNVVVFKIEPEDTHTVVNSSKLGIIL